MPPKQEESILTPENYWKIYKDGPDHIEARLMCSGETEGGTKIKEIQCEFNQGTSITKLIIIYPL